MPPLESDFFPASYDATTKVLSAILCAILVGVFIGTRTALAGGIGALVLALGYAYSPRGYTVRNRSIVVRRLIGNVTVSLGGIREARGALKDDFRGCIRLWGSYGAAAGCSAITACSARQNSGSPPGT